MLSNFWYIACTSQQLRRSPRQAQVLSRNIVLFRASDGTPVALENRCAHRGMPLAAGKICGDQLQCPYHGWRYDSSGAVVAIPSAPDGGVDLTTACIPAYACREQDEYVWVCPGGKPDTDLPLRFPNLGRPGWTTFSMYNRFESPVESCLENFLDCPHATFVHRSWFRSPTKRKVRCSVQALDDGAVAEYFDEPREKSLVWSLLSPAKGGMRHTDRYIAPTTTRVDYIFSEDRHYIITSSCTPVNDELTDVYTVITFRYNNLGRYIRLFFEPMSRRIIAQDVKTLRQQYRNLEKYDDMAFRVIEQDVLLPHIRQWRKSLGEGKRPAGTMKPYDLDVVI